MLKAEFNPKSTRPWSKVQALSSLIQLKSGNSSRSPPNSNNPPVVSHSNTVNNSPQQPSLQPEQLPKPDRLKVFVSTWNMYGNLPRDLDLEPFLTSRRPSSPSATPATSPTSPSESSKVFVEHHTHTGGGSPFLDTSTGHPYHLLAIGTQECERDISESLFYSSKEVWEQRLSEYLGDQYKLLRCETLAALHLAVFVWKPVASYVKNIHSADIKTGWANMVGNKGAVAVSLDFGSQSLLFINCHLRAHQTKLAERNANVQRILHGLQIKGGRPISHDQSHNGLFHLPSLKKLARSSKSSKSTKSAGSKRRGSKHNSLKYSKPKPNQKATKSPAPSTKSSTRITTKNAPSGSDTAKHNTDAPNDTKPTANTEGSTTKDLPATTKSTTSTTRDKKKRASHTRSSSYLSSSSSISPSIASTSIPAEDQHSVTEQFDHVFIFGDTNYRINAERQFVLDNIKRQDFKTLLKYDQLTLERQKGTTPLACFNEHPIDFIPTYKFDTLETMDTSDSSSSSLPLSPSSTAAVQQNQPAGSSSSTPQTPLTASTDSSTSSSHSIVITPKHSLHHFGTVSVRYDTSPKQRVPSWTDRILWHDRQQHHHQPDGNAARGVMTLPSTVPPSGTTMTSISSTNTTTTATTANPQIQPTSKNKLNLKWISALKRKSKSSNLGRDAISKPIDKSTVCYHYNTVMDPRLMGASDHLPVIGIFGIWFDDWENGAYRRAKSIKSFKTKVPLWRKLLQ